MNSRRPRPSSSAKTDASDSEEIRDDEGLLVDEYTSEAFADPDAIDALDVPLALEDLTVLDDVADTGDGIQVVDNSGIIADEDGAEMGLGAEPHTPEELADAAIGHELRGRGAVTRDGVEHGERLMDRSAADDQ